MFYGDRADPARVLEATARGCVRVWTSPRCPTGSAGWSSSPCGSGRPRWFSAVARTAHSAGGGRYADRAGHRACRCATAARWWARCGSRPARVRRALATRDAEILAVVCDQVAPGGGRPSALRTAPAQPRRPRDRPRGGAPTAAARPARRRRRGPRRRAAAGGDGPGPGRRPGGRRPAHGPPRPASPPPSTTCEPSPTTYARPALDDLGLGGRPARAGRPDGHARHRDRRSTSTCDGAAAGRGRGRLLPDRGRGAGERRASLRRPPGRRSRADATPSWVSLAGRGRRRRPTRADPGRRARAWPRCANARRRSAAGWPSRAPATGTAGPRRTADWRPDDPRSCSSTTIRCSSTASAPR